jgi:hypothetical protein
MWSAAIIRCVGAARHLTRHPVELGAQEIAFGVGPLSQPLVRTGGGTRGGLTAFFDPAFYRGIELLTLLRSE